MPVSLARAMSPAARSVFWFGFYPALTGVVLVLAPNLLLTLSGLPPTREAWIRLMGMLLVIIGFFYVQAGRAGLTPFFHWTIVSRLGSGAVVGGLVAGQLASPVSLLFWLVDLAGAIWTWHALRSEVH